MTRPKRNFFDLRHDVKLSCNMGELVPFCLLECIPGDKFHLDCNALVRFAPMVAPIMHRVNVYMHYFFVPNRILWQGWEQWITRDPQSPSETFPFVDMDQTNAITGSLADYLGVPPYAGNAWANEGERINAMPFAAYQCIWHEFYRDQNLQNSLINPQQFWLTDGDNTGNSDLFALRSRAWEHDYFTSALPFAQKGQAVSLPLGEITFDPAAAIDTGILPKFRELLGSAEATAGGIDQTNFPPTGLSSSGEPGSSIGYDPAGTLVTNATTINDLRRAFRLQEYLEKNARGGTRYIEHILMHFGVKGSDRRLQRPEYITGTQAPVMISEVLNTTGDTGAAEPLPQGNMSGHGVSVTKGKYGKYYCEEHGFIIGIMSVRPQSAYAQGLEKHWTKTTDPTQYFYDSFANIGEQPVENREIAAYLDPGTDVDQAQGTFGYVPRYADYKYKSSRIAGDFRSTLDYWTMTRLFETQPLLNNEFVECNPDHRIFAVTDTDFDKLYVHVNNQITAVRGMPKYGSPSF